MAESRQQIKEKILNLIKELYFIKQNRFICDFQPDLFYTPDIQDEDLIDDEKFSRLLKYDAAAEATAAATAAVATTTSTVSTTTPHPGKAKAKKEKEAVSDDMDVDIVEVVPIHTETDPEEPDESIKLAEPSLSVSKSDKSDQPMEVESTQKPTQVVTKAVEHMVKPSSISSKITTPKQVFERDNAEKLDDSTQSAEKSLPIDKLDDSQPMDVEIDHPKKTDDSIPPPPEQSSLADRSESVDQRSEVDAPQMISTVVEHMVAPATPSAETTQRQIFERARHEAEVQARVAELRRQGLWSRTRLPKLQEPPRPKVHWDYLLEEARWMCGDFDMEKKWKRRAAKKCAYAAVRYLHEKKCAKERLVREEIQQKKKVAASYAKDVKSFWSVIEKIVDFRQQTKLEETRKKAWGLHLNYILDQTSKFSNTCLDGVPTPTAKEIENDYLKSQNSDNADGKESVINNDEQTKTRQNQVDDLTAGAQSIQPKGNTLETTTVSTKVPFLLKHTLREYQHIGLDWLVAMNKKQLNGILADEMGLGKTIQTIALLAHLACEEQDWGPHLIVVPTSVMLNWEMEFKKWCPAFKILTYYGNPKERRMKRVGWSRPNSFHVCITSYRIVIQDHNAFRRKQWSYFILDEAHYIKNFKSQRWQMLLNFNSKRRLLLTGTPLQNDLMELWSLMHFLMPGLFDSYREFKDWFVNPMTGMVEGSQEYNEELVARLHQILRPFLLRRLKADVEKQLPSKKEIIRYCRLSKRQRFLYEEFMSLSKTKETLAKGNFLSVINVLMQLRKVCNHPNLFEPRPTMSPFMMGSIAYKVPGILLSPLDYNPYVHVDLSNLQLSLIETGVSLTSLAHEYIKSRSLPAKKIVEELDCESVSDVNSCSQDDSSSVMEVDETPVIVMSEKVNNAYMQLKEIRRADKRSRLEFMAGLNETRCTKSSSLYFSDLRDHLYLNNLSHMVKSSVDNCNVFSNGNGTILCSQVHELRSKPRYKLDYLSSLIDETIQSPQEIVQSLSAIIDRYVFCVPGASASPVSMHISNPSSSKKAREAFFRETLYESLSPKFNLLSKIATNMRTSFPELRLIEYDCGKLQTLGRLLTELKSNDHRVLIFTQMSRMLDILEQFLNYYGYTYLRLDGATKIDQRQILMERFNNDKRIFCFILSTRSGGIGVNLTGADTVIFYDSDWNPTMDAQAQDRCHRIGQTRDVHIYRLICEDTVEQNIYRKAQQKKMLGDLAIEDGNFNASSFKRHKIREFFESNPEPEEVVSMEVDTTETSNEMTSAQMRQFEQALMKTEKEAGEEMDVDAIKVAKIDVETDLREFDETIPLTEESSPVEKSEKEQQIDEIVAQMTPIERYAVNFLESLQQPKNKEELEQAEMEYRMELENKKSQWEQSRIELLKEQSTKNVPKSETMLTYPRGAKCEHVHYLLDGEKTIEEMPLWAPPTPPTSPPSPVEDNNQYHYQPPMTPAMAARISAMGGLGNIFNVGSDSNKSDTRHFINEKDLYVDYTHHFLYEPNVMPESQLPPVNQQYTDNEATSYTFGSKKIRLTGTPVVPGGYFQTPSQLPHLQQHLQNLTNIPTTPDGSMVVAPGQPGQRKPKVRRDEVICLPKSIFDRQTPNFAKIRRELKLQKLRCVTKGNDSDPFAMQKFFHSFSLNPLGQSLQQETIVSTVYRQMQNYNNPSIMLAYHQDQLPPWTIQEEWALLMVIQHLQDLPVNLCILTPGHTPNWELVSEVISDVGFTYRSYKMCEYHFALNVQKREMTRDSSWDQRALPSSQSSDSSQPPAKKSKKHKNQQASSDAPASSQSSSSKSGQSGAQTVPFKPSKTGSMLANDKSLQLSYADRFEIIKRIRQTRPKPIRPPRHTAAAANREHALSNPQTLMRADNRLIYYDRPLKPEVIIHSLRAAGSGGFRTQ